ncbi:hypothetical protein TcasGA2_TC034246 [Tribolium castaneum]|uniref:Uncharacterized protein n=1 Tax=Tribolium castaneum TaxID=7070 RepID=A0A139WC32_TRICA|nr:hypothetical protein TcasGA2_TC034246 [Tribolium castaneum]
MVLAERRSLRARNRDSGSRRCSCSCNSSRDMVGVVLRGTPPLSRPGESRRRAAGRRQSVSRVCKR